MEPIIKGLLRQLAQLEKDMDSMRDQLRKVHVAIRKDNELQAQCFRMGEKVFAAGKVRGIKDDGMIIIETDQGTVFHVESNSCRHQPEPVSE